MNDARFAALGRFLEALGTRRRLVQGGLAALGTAALGRNGAMAARRNRRRKRNDRGGSGRLGAANCTVCDDEDDCPFTTIQAAIDGSTAGSTITVCEETYKEDITIGKNLSLVAAQGEDVELEGTRDGSVVTVAAQVTATIHGMVIRDGVGSVVDGARSGGGILNHGHLTVSNTLIENNEAEFGGGIFNATGARLTLDHCTLQENGTTSGSGNILGGGIYNRLGAEVNLINGSRIVESEAHNGGAIHNSGVLNISGRSLIFQNDADLDGGGILNDNGDITIDGSQVLGNKAQGNGGGIFNFNGSLIIRNHSEIGDNQAELGGGIFNQHLATMTLIDSVVTDNEAGGMGGGIFNGGGGVELQSGAVFGNDANRAGGGIFNTQGGVVTLDNQSAVVGNKPNNCVGTNACGA